jgi:hypothetical protein
VNSSVSWMAACFSNSSSHKETEQHFDTSSNVASSAQITRRKFCYVEAHVNFFWRHVFCCLWQSNDYIKHTNTVNRFVAEDVSPYWPAAIAYGRYYSSTLFNLTSSSLDRVTLVLGGEARRLYVENFSTKITCHNAPKQENILVLLFHPRIKFCLPFIHVIHKFQLYMKFFYVSVLKTSLLCVVPSKDNSLHGLFL